MYNKYWTFGLVAKWVRIIQICCSPPDSKGSCKTDFIMFIHGQAFSIMNLKLVNQVYKGMHQVIILKRNVDRRIIIVPNHYVT